MKYGAADATNSSYNENKHNTTVTPPSIAVDNDNTDIDREFHSHCLYGEDEKAALLLDPYKKTTKNINQRVSLSQSSQAPSYSPLQLAIFCATKNFPQKNKNFEASKRYKGAMKIIKMLLDDSDIQLNKQEVTYVYLHGTDSVKLMFLTHPKVNFTLIDVHNPEVIKSLAKTINSNPNIRKAIISNLLNPNPLLSEVEADNSATLRAIMQVLCPKNLNLITVEDIMLQITATFLSTYPLQSQHNVTNSDTTLDHIVGLMISLHKNPRLPDSQKILFEAFINELISRCPNLLNGPNVRKQALYLAIKLGNVRIVKILLPETYFSNVNTPKYFKYFSQNEEMAKLLITALETDQIHPLNLRTTTLLEQAIKSCNSRIVQILLPKTHFSTENAYNCFKLFLEYQPMLKLLITALQTGQIQPKYRRLLLECREDENNDPDCIALLLGLIVPTCPLCLEESGPDKDHSSCLVEYGNT